ncbi:MAG: thiamine-phosphate kinase [Actinobacteria bacterium]|nr:MAG: thiamine-phosphate kinase [Actinomycetota bacterium]
MAERLRLMPGAEIPETMLGIGDDAAVIERREGPPLLFTIDSMVEDVHFLPDIPAEYAGYKALAINASDIAAMGGRPLAALVSFVAPRQTDVEWLDAVYDGFAQAASFLETPLLGGDTAVGPRIVLTVAMLGSCPDTAPVLRSGARPGDVVCVTGRFGGATGGLRILAMERLIRKPEEDYGHPGLRLLDRHLKPQPRLEAGRRLAKAGATAMIDVSDGLVADLGHVCERSGVKMTVEAMSVPIDVDLEAVADKVTHNVLETALTGGEDFELAVTLPPDAFKKAAAAVKGTGIPLTRIGVVEDAASREGDDVLVLQDGEPVRFAQPGWIHFEGK